MLRVDRVVSGRAAVENDHVRITGNLLWWVPEGELPELWAPYRSCCSSTRSGAALVMRMCSAFGCAASKVKAILGREEGKPIRGGRKKDSKEKACGGRRKKTIPRKK